MNARRSRMGTAAAIAAAAWLPVTSGAATIDPPPIIYTEEIAAGPSRFNDGRRLPEDRRAYGIDIDSLVRLDVDEDELRADSDGACLEVGERHDLERRLEQLRVAAATLGNAAASVEAALAAFSVHDSPDGRSEFFDRAEWMADLLLPVIEALEPALRPYLKRQGVSESKLATEVGLLQREILAGENGYNWPLIRRILYSEIEAVADQLEQLDRSLEIQAHLIQVQGATPLALPGYNTVGSGPERLHQRLRFGEDLAAEKKEADEAIDKAKEEGEEAKMEVAAKKREVSAALAGKRAESEGAKTEDQRKKAKDELETLATMEKRLEQAGEIAETAAGLPQPAGLEPRPLHGNLDTSFDLKTVREVRPQPGDRVEVRSRVVCGEEPLVGSDRTDSFTVRAFGWTDAAFPVIAFTQLDGRSSWEGDGGFSWLLRRNRWPKDGEADRSPPQLRWWGGVGISALELDFDEEESIEIGFALTTAFIQDRLVAGYGIDLQKDDDREFWFFSVRVFPKFSLLEKAKGGSK